MNILEMIVTQFIFLDGTTHFPHFEKTLLSDLLWVRLWRRRQWPGDHRAGASGVCRGLCPLGVVAWQTDTSTCSEALLSSGPRGGRSCWAAPRLAGPGPAPRPHSPAFLPWEASSSGGLGESSLGLAQECWPRRALSSSLLLWPWLFSELVRLPSLGVMEGQPLSRPGPLMFLRDRNCPGASPPRPWAMDAELASGETLPEDIGAVPTPQLWNTIQPLPLYPTALGPALPSPEGPSPQPLSPCCPALRTAGPRCQLCLQHSPFPYECFCLFILFACSLSV